MSKTIYNADYSECLPEALKKDPKMVALANATAAALLDTSGIIDNVLIYSRFDELPEELVDILAYDLHVDWYDYNYPLEAKRDLVKNSVKVHKKMGTKYAIETALGSLFPESEVEEWFQYEGEPGHFHIVLDVTNQRITADYAAIIRAVKMYKRLSAHMDELTYQGQVHGVIYTHGEYFRYKTPLTGRLNAGTYPQRNTKAGIGAATYIVGTEAAGFIFTAPAAGTKPYRNTVFSQQAAHIDADTALNTFGYTNTPAGRIKAGEQPQRNTKAGIGAATYIVGTEAAGFIFTAPAAGTKPYRNTVFSQQAAHIDADTALNTFGYTNTPAGRIKAGEQPQRNTRGQTSGATVTAAGTVPERSTVQQTQGGAVGTSTQAMGFSYGVKPCGSRRKL